MSTKVGTVVMLLWITVFSGCGSNDKEYGYVFEETTGQNQFIVIERLKFPVKAFISDAPNKVALDSLLALKWNVLYANGAGDRIVLVGEYEPHGKSFRLTHWYLKVPFEALVVKDEAVVPHEIHKVTRQSLERTDFESDYGFDPNNPAFDPKAFQRAQ